MVETVLIIGGSGGLLRQLQRACDSIGVRAAQVRHFKEAAEFLAQGSAELVIGDSDSLEQLRSERPGLPSILLTDSPDSRQTIEAMKRGSLDCLNLPIRQEDLQRRLRDALRLAAWANQPAPLKPGTPRQPSPKGVRLVGQSPAMQEVYKQIGRVAPRDINVLIVGESGTGKELIARAVWEHSTRFDKPFLAVNCAAIPETLLESELFGHEKGAFTGAESRRIGKFEQCDGGTLFLDEIGDIPLPTQAKLLRVLQEHSFQRIGGNVEVRCDVRILAATHQPLEQMVAQRLFRQDLYFRIKVATIEVPPLRDREVDPVLLAHYFVHRLNPQMGTEVRGFDPEAVAALLAYSWPGNVRELENVIKAALVESRGPILQKEFLPPHVLSARSATTGPEGEAQRDQMPPDPANLAQALVADRGLHGRVLDLGVQRIEQELICAALEQTGGVLIEAARLLGVSRTTLRKKMLQYRIELRSMPVKSLHQATPKK
ncbi:MAG: hypothetical protein AMXMBFR13_24100 [Phycisphaerae bacterium]|jgi:two-component system nitrogen regulation response regulator GlnG